jgi:TonB family protein
MNEFVLKLLINAAWQVLLCGAVGWTAARLFRRWPAVWTATLWRAAICLAAIVPVLTALWDPPAREGSFHISIAVAGTSSATTASAQTSWLTLAYLGLVTFMGIRLLWQWRALRHLDEENVITPVAFGWSNPQVILPRHFTAVAPEIAKRAALAQEYTYLRNHDFLFNLLVEAITIPVLFHPALAWMKRQMANAVEVHCDEDAAREFGNANEYMLGLIEAARVLGAPPSPRLAASFFDHNVFEERIMNLTQPKSQPRRRARLFAVVSLTATALFVAGLSASFAAQQPEKVYKINESGVQAPKLLHKIEPNYPKGATAVGAIVLAVEISAKGKAENIVVKRSLGVEFDQSAIDAIKQWSFQPATKDGQPVRVSATVEVNFRRD